MELLTLLKRVEHCGAVKTTHRVQQNRGQLFRYAVATGCAESDPSRDLRGALTPWKPEHCPTLTDARDVCRLLRDIEAYEGGFVMKCAMKLSPMLFVRPGELRRAEWNEINLDAAEWRVPSRSEDEGASPAYRPACDAGRQHPAPTAGAHRKRSLGVSGRSNQRRADEREHSQRSIAAAGLRPHVDHGRSS
jgi:integrase